MQTVAENRVSSYANNICRIGRKKTRWKAEQDAILIRLWSDPAYADNLDMVRAVNSQIGCTFEAATGRATRLGIPRAGASYRSPLKSHIVLPIRFLPTNHLPGSTEKMKVMRSRVEAGLPLFHPDDRTIKE